MPNELPSTSVSLNLSLLPFIHCTGTRWIPLPILKLAVLQVYYRFVRKLVSPNYKLREADYVRICLLVFFVSTFRHDKKNCSTTQFSQLCSGTSVHSYHYNETQNKNWIWARSENNSTNTIRNQRQCYIYIIQTYIECRNTNWNSTSFFGRVYIIKKKK